MVEKDVDLLRKLLSLSESLRELRERRQQKHEFRQNEAEADSDTSSCSSSNISQWKGGSKLDTFRVEKNVGDEEEKVLCFSTRLKKRKSN